MGYLDMSKRDKLEIRAMAQEFSDLALKTLVNVMRRGETDRDRVTAAKEILDRAWGKSVQGHQLEPTDPDAGITDEMLERAERFTHSIQSIASRSKISKDEE